ncbi:DUF6221 family protein [Streptomyces halstedii]|uniref:DUF6221 family protein n=1 Tax=Streptomyces halstedii TaxID=1944 RepID=UPI00345F6947
MTAQGEDVLAFLNAAIAEHERVAQEACDGGDGRWHSGWCPDDEIEEGETSGAGVSDERDRTVVYDEGYPSKAQSVHIALNDPASVLRRCAADRKLIALHRPQMTGAGFPDIQQCRTCSADSLGDGYQYLVPAPCLSLLALAEGYGWAEGKG